MASNKVRRIRKEIASLDSDIIQGRRANGPRRMAELESLRETLYQQLREELQKTRDVSDENQ